MNTCQLGSLGEAKTIAKLTELGWTIFVPLSGHCKYDLLAEDKEGNLVRVSVKSSAKSVDKSNAYQLSIKQISPNSNSYNTKVFDPKSCDLLACYIVELDVVCFVWSREVLSHYTISFRQTTTNKASSRYRLIKDHLVP